MNNQFTIPPALYQATAIAIALETYAKHGIRVNRLYTPKNMMRTASAITKKKFRANDYLTAAKALRAFANDLKTNVKVETPKEGYFS